MRTRHFLAALALALLSFAASAAEDQLSTALTRQMKMNGQRYGIAGQALLVMHNGKVIFRGVSGYANVDTHELVRADDIFPVYSVSKLFVSTLVMQLAEQGQVDLDRPASKYLAGLPAHWQGITVRQFLNHTSGVPEYFNESRGAMVSPQTVAFPASAQAAFSSLSDKPLLFQPGNETRYTQTNYLVLSALLAAHYGKPYPQVASERIIEKLQLKHTWLGAARLPKSGVVESYIGKDGKLQRDDDIAWPEYSFGHASLYLSLDDLARFLEAVRTGQFVGKAALQQFWQPLTLGNGMRGWFASGWDYGESGAFRHVGHDGGTRVRVRMLFKESLDGDSYTFVYLTNGSAKNVWSRTLIDSAMAVVAPKQFPAEGM